MSSREFLVRVTAVARVEVEAGAITPTAEAVRQALEDDLTIGMSREPFYDRAAGGFLEFVGGQETSRSVEVTSTPAVQEREHRRAPSKTRPRNRQAPKAS
jgi:hypothetical protein